MSKLTVSGISTSPASRWADGTAYLQIFYYNNTGQAFSFSTREIWQPSTETFYREIPVTVASNVVTVASVELDTTTDIVGPSPVQLMWRVVNGSRSSDDAILLGQGWQVPTSLEGLTTVTYEMLRQHNTPAARALTDTSTYSRSQLDLMLADAVNVGNPATTSAIGRVKMSVAPSDAASPVAVGDNDPRVGVDSSDYASLSAAVTAIGATPTTLVITSAFPSGASCTVPSTLALKFIPGQGSIVRGSGHTVTIRSSTKDWPVAQIFSGPGAMSFSGNRAVGDIRPEFFGAVADDATDCTAAFTEMLHLAEYNGSITGARFKLSDGIYRVTGLTYRGDFQHAFILEGQAAGAGLSGSIIKYTGASGGTVFVLLGATDCIVKNVAFHGNALAKYGVLLDYDASRSQGSFNCTLDHIIVGGVTGVDSAGIVLGTSNFASAEHTLIHPNVVGHGAATTYYGVLNAGSANAKNYRIKTGSIQNCKWGISLSGSGYHQIDSVSFASNTEGDIKAAGAQMSLRDCGSEGSTRFIDGRASSETGGILVEASNWAGATSGDDFIVIYAGQLTLVNCDFYNSRNATSLPALKLGVGAAPRAGSLVSLNNIFDRPPGAPAPSFIPVYDGSDVPVSTAAPGQLYDGYSNPNASAGTSIFSFGDKSREVSGNIDVHFPVRLTGRMTYTLGISQTAVESKNLRGSATLSSGSAAVSFTVAEPNTDYFIVLSGNANETFRWSSKATGGFTITSSNAASTAQVDWVLIR